MILIYSINTTKAPAIVLITLKRTTVKVTAHAKKARNEREKNEVPNNGKMEPNEDIKSCSRLKLRFTFMS